MNIIKTKFKSFLHHALEPVPVPRADVWSLNIFIATVALSIISFVIEKFI